MVKKSSTETKEKVEENTEKQKSSRKKITTIDYEKKVLELAETGLTSEKIGEQLRKQGIHPSEHGKRISEILKEKGKYYDPELKTTEEKLERLRSHYDKNKQDKKAMRERDRIAAKVRKIKNYLKIFNK